MSLLARNMAEMFQTVNIPNTISRVVKECMHDLLAKRETRQPGVNNLPRKWSSFRDRWRVSE